MHPKPYTGRHILGKFCVNRSSDSLEISAREKKRKKSKATEKYILPHFAKTVINKQYLNPSPFRCVIDWTISFLPVKLAYVNYHCLENVYNPANSTSPQPSTDFAAL